ncbi:MAG: hypothetical protein OXC83_05780 [Chloroflexi bacterium]|nr:hypothetical protein [Chloroflexota bacterium]
MRTVATIILGGFIDLFALPVTIPIWKLGIHDPIAATPTYGMRSVDVTLFLVDAVSAIFIVVGIGMILAAFFVTWMLGLSRNQF